jgi:polyphenol oxidase
MNRVAKNGLEVFQFEEKEFENCIHGISTRHGGVSQPPWVSLNQGGTVGDSHENVVENRKRVFSFFERDVESIFDVWQVHSTTTICTSQSRGLYEAHSKADAIFTNNPNITLFMRFADCVPILIFDPIKYVVGIIHAGWKGTVNNIVSESIKTIKEKYSVTPSNLIAGIGPSIGPDHYIVGEEVIAQVRSTFGDYANNLLEKKDGKTFLNLWKANEYLLRQQGVESIESAEICTACHIEDWYSHRAEKGATGRFGALIALKE